MKVGSLVLGARCLVLGGRVASTATRALRLQGSDGDATPPSRGVRSDCGEVAGRVRSATSPQSLPWGPEELHKLFTDYAPVR
jgi:hypothetical protein